MKELKKFLEKIVKETTNSANETYDVGYCAGRVDLARKILSEYLTDSKFCQCESCKEQHERIKNS